MVKNKSKLFLDSKAICFLCFKSKNVGEEVESGSSGRQISLRAIARFLNLDIWKIYHELKPDIKSKNNMEGEVFVNLCAQCSDIMEYCTELYNILEETQVLLSGCLSKMLGIMESGRSDSSRVEEMKGLLQGQDSVCLDHFEKLREKIISRCNLKLKKQVPLVKLSRLPSFYLKRKTLPEVASSPPKKIFNVIVKSEMEDYNEDVEMPIGSPASPSIDEEIQPRVEKPALNWKTNAREMKQLIFRAYEDDGPESSKTDTATVKSNSIRDRPFIQRSPQGPAICQYCQRELRSIANVHLHFHLRSYHAEFYFPKLRKLSNLPPVGFNKIVAHFLSKFLKNGDCSLCSQKYSSYESDVHSRFVRNHLVRNHLEILEKDMMLPENLKEFMKETNTLILSYEEKEGVSILQKGVKFKVEGASKSQYICPHCIKNFYKNYTLKDHIVSFHKDKYFPNMKKSHVTDNQYKIILENLIFKDLIKHSNCVLCPTWENERGATRRLLGVKMHLLENHHQLLVEKLEQIQDDGNLLKEVYKARYSCQCGVLFASKKDFLEHNNTCRFSIKAEIREKCEACGRMVLRNRFKRHRNGYCKRKTRIPKSLMTSLS